MEPSKTVRERIEAARQLEKEDRLTDAAAIYQKIVDTDPAHREAIGRLLVMYRKGKEYRKELAVINAALAAWQQRGKTLQDKWLREHPNAAGAGRSILRSLIKGGEKTAALGSDPVVDGWIKRKALVTQRLTGKKSPVRSKPKKQPAAATISGAAKKKAALEHKASATAESKKAALERKAALAAESKKATLERKAALAAERKKASLERKAAAAVRKAEALAKKKAAQVTQMHPSLFIITIRYKVSLKKIDAAMPQHMAWLNKHYEKGDFIVSGRQVPRTGGIIVGRGKDRKTVEKIINDDPFVKKNLAATDIVEFSASQMSKGLKGWLTPDRN